MTKKYVSEDCFHLINAIKGIGVWNYCNLPEKDLLYIAKQLQKSEDVLRIVEHLLKANYNRDCIISFIKNTTRIEGK